MEQDKEFKDPFNIWWFLAILAALALPLLHAIAGVFVYVIGN